MKQTAWAPSNIALVKYWGKRDAELRLPLNASLSMTTDEAFTITTVEFSPEYLRDTVEIDTCTSGVVPMEETAAERVLEHVGRIRKRAGSTLFARIRTKNSFPMGVGAASSASGFAALTVAACAALGLELSQKEMTILARLGSGSACRSIPDGFVLWEAGEHSEDSFAYSIYPHTYWSLCDVLVFVDERKKSVSTTDGMGKAMTSPFMDLRLKEIPRTIECVRKALEIKDIVLLGECVEREMFSMHAVMMTQNPPVLYWSDATLRVFRAIWEARSRGMKAYCTVDAGANVHVICGEEDAKKVAAICSGVDGVVKIVVCRPAPGAHTVSTHLF